MYSVLLGSAFHRREKAYISVFIGSPCRHHAPKVHCAIIADFPYDNLYLSALNDRNDAPVAHRLALPDPLLMAFDIKLLDAFFKLLIGRREANKIYCKGQEIEAQDLGGSFPLRTRTFEDKMIETLGSEMDMLMERRGHDAADAVIELLGVFAQFVVIG